MTARPKIKPDLTGADRMLNAVGWAALLILWAMVLFNYNATPDTIPTHFNTAGEADAHGDKTTLLVVCAIATVLFIGLLILNRYPYLFNYTANITEDNAAAHYALATRMIRAMNICMMVIFIIVAFAMQNGHKNFMGWLIASIAFTLVPVVWYFIQARKVK